MSLLMKVTLYIIKGILSGKKYVGITNDLQRRLREHHDGNSKGGQLIGDFELIHTEEFDDYSSARRREIFLKSGQGRKWINDSVMKTRPARGG
jgi:putative endonuclease